MLAAIMRWGGSFLASKAVTVILIAAVTGAGSYILYVIKDRGTLETKLDQAEQNASYWRQQAGNIQELRDRFDRFDQELAAARRERQRLMQSVDREIGRLRRELPSVDAYLSGRAPPELTGVLCRDGTIDPASPDCAADP